MTTNDDRIEAGLFTALILVGCGMLIGGALLLINELGWLALPAFGGLAIVARGVYRRVLKRG